MERRAPSLSRLALVALALAGSLAAPSGGARAAEPAKGEPSAPAQPETPVTELPRETAVETSLGRAGVGAGNSFGGYGELTYSAPSNGQAVVDLRRFVLYFGHDYSEHIRFYSEVEVEHAVSSATDKGEVEIEQAYLDGLLHRKLNLRGGVILMPVGIVNVYHEPPSFNGVDRPDVDLFVIPTTWREPGIGVFGELAEGLRYQLYFVNGLNANGFTAESAIAEGHQEAQLANAGVFGGVARLDYEPVLGTVLGVSAYSGTSRTPPLPPSIGRVPVTLLEADARTRVGAFSARAEVAFLFIGDAGALSHELADVNPDAPPIASQSRGAYLEVAYDLLTRFAPRTGQGLAAFVRFDYADTQAVVPAGFAARTEFRRYSEVMGLVYRPIPQIGLKADYRFRQFGDHTTAQELASAITWLF